LKVIDLSISLNGNKILNNLSIDFWDGLIHALVGPNGAGKSTFAATIMGLRGYEKAQGDIIFKNSSIKNSTIEQRAKKGITLAWQEPARYEGLTVQQFISASTSGKDNEETAQALKIVGLDPSRYLKRAVDKTLSGGERKKIELASIVAMKPAFVMLDEPDSGIDVSSLEKIFDSINILKENGSTVLLITHSLTVLNHSEHAFLMCCGKLIDKGPVDKIRPYFENKCIPCDHTNKPVFD